MFYLYILQSQKDFSYYVGSTGNLADRLDRHNSGRSKSTKSKVPWMCVHTEVFSSRSDATKREREIKNKKSKKYINWLVNENKMGA